MTEKFELTVILTDEDAEALSFMVKRTGIDECRRLLDRPTKEGKAFSILGALEPIADALFKEGFQA